MYWTLGILLEFYCKIYSEQLNIEFFAKVFSVADLVTPVPNFAVPRGLRQLRQDAHQEPPE